MIKAMPFRDAMPVQLAILALIQHSLLNLVLRDGTKILSHKHRASFAQLVQHVHSLAQPHSRVLSTLAQQQLFQALRQWQE